jgi:hypothetical protein
MKYATSLYKVAYIALYAVCFPILANATTFIPINPDSSFLNAVSQSPSFYYASTTATAPMPYLGQVTTLRFTSGYATPQEIEADIYATHTTSAKPALCTSTTTMCYSGNNGATSTTGVYNSQHYSATPNLYYKNFTEYWYFCDSNGIVLGGSCSNENDIRSSPIVYYFAVDFDVNTLQATPQRLDLTPAYIISISPAYGSTTATTTVELSITYRNDGQYNSVGFSIANYDPDGFGLLVTTTTPMTTGTTTVNFGNFELVQGYWTGSFSMVSDTAGTISQPIYFLASSSRTLDAWYEKISASSTADIQSYCAGKSGIDAILCKIPDAIIAGVSFLFKPSDTTFDRFKSLKTSIEKKPPFGYISVSLDVVNGLTASSTGIFSLQQEGNITATIFDPIKNGIGMILYVFWAFVMFHRVRHIDI